MNITLTFPSHNPPPPSSNIRTLKKWSELSPDDGFSSARGQAPGATAGQQALYTPYLLKDGVWVGSWGANQNSPTITNADWLRIASMQIADSYSVAAKMNHISCDGQDAWGQAIRATYDPSSDWQNARDIKINQCPYAGNTVTILERRVMTIDTFGTVPMVRIATGWNQVHVYTAVTSDNRHYTEVKGRIVLPLLARAGWEWWILERWLV